MGKARSIPAVLEDVKPVESGPIEAVAPPRPITIKTIRRRVARGEKFAALTCYDATTARWLERAGVPILLVGDTAAEVILGFDRTVDMPLDIAVALTAAVKRGAPNTLVMAVPPGADCSSQPYPRLKAARGDSQRFWRHQLPTLDDGPGKRPVLLAW